MSYMRVIPRDLFNEGNLLKCYGRVYINLETLNVGDVTLEHDGEAFDIVQCPDDGSLHVDNVRLVVRGVAFRMFRPLNSREAWPLYVLDGDDECEVFNDNGGFSAEFREFLERAA